MSEHHHHTGRGDCELCGEGFRLNEQGGYAEEVGEFWDHTRDRGVMAHADCGLDAGFELA